MREANQVLRRISKRISWNQEKEWFLYSKPCKTSFEILSPALGSGFKEGYSQYHQSVKAALQGLLRHSEGEPGESLQELP